MRCATWRRAATICMIGTQLVAKGHHFPELTLVGVVDADLALETTDPRAGERTWQILAQVAGRAGRGERPGRALVQTYLPDHPLMTALKAGDRDGFSAMNKGRARPRCCRLMAGSPAIIGSGRDAGEKWSASCVPWQAACRWPGT